MLAAFLIGVSRSKESEIIKPEGAVKGRALIVYDAGFTGGTKTAAGYFADDLKSEGYDVKLAGVRSDDALDISGYNLLIIGSPNYGSRPTKPVETYLNEFKVPENAIVGVYSLSGGNVEATNIFMSEILKEKSIHAKVSKNYGNSAFGAGNKNKYSEFVRELLA